MYGQLSIFCSAVNACRFCSYFSQPASGHSVFLADVSGRRTLRSIVTSHLTVPSIKLSTIGSRALLLAAVRQYLECRSGLGRSASLHFFSGGPVGLPARWATTSNVKGGVGRRRGPVHSQLGREGSILG